MPNPKGGQEKKKRKNRKNATNMALEMFLLLFGAPPGGLPDIHIDR